MMKNAAKENYLDLTCPYCKGGNPCCTYCNDLGGFNSSEIYVSVKSTVKTPKSILPTDQVSKKTSIRNKYFFLFPTKKKSQYKKKRFKENPNKAIIRRRPNLGETFPETFLALKAIINYNNLKK